MKNILILLLTLGTLSSHGSAAFGSINLFDTDRFGYDGTIERYGSLGDALSEVDLTGTITVNDRDLSLYLSDDYNVVMGSWWYTIDDRG